MLKSFLFFFVVLNFFSATFVNALEKDRLLTFFKEYNASVEKKEWNWGRLPYAIEKEYYDVAESFILNSDALWHYSEFSPIAWNKSEMDIYYKCPLLTAIRKGNVALAVLMAKIIGNISSFDEFKNICLLERKEPLQYRHKEVDRKHAIYVAIAESANGYNIIDAFLNAGIDTNIKRICKNHEGEDIQCSSTPLKTAIFYRKLDIAELLLANNFDVEEEGIYKTTPLYLAVEANCFEGVILLINYGANPLKKSPYGEQISPLELAIRKEYWDIVDILLDAAVEKETIQGN